MRANDTQVTGFRPKAEPGTDAYKRAVAEPTMAAIDGMPAAFRECVRDFDYINVYRAWRRGWTPQAIRQSAAKNGGKFDF